MAINPLAAFGTGLFQAYQQHQLRQLQQEQALLNWQKQLLDRALQVFPHLPISGKVSILTGLARFGVISQDQLEKIAEELFNSEAEARQERLATIVNRLEGSIRDLPPEHKALAYTRVFGALGIKVDEDLVKSLADSFRREGFPKVANALSQIAPNLGKLPVQVQVSVLSSALQQMGYNPDEKMLEAIYNDILKKDAMTQIRDLLPFTGRNRSDFERIIAGTAINTIARNVEGLPVMPLERTIQETSPVTLGILTKPYGQERAQREAAKDFERIVQEQTNKGVDLRTAMEVAGTYVRGKYGGSFGFLPPDTSLRELRRAQARWFERRPTDQITPSQIGGFYSLEEEYSLLEPEERMAEKLASYGVEAERIARTGSQQEKDSFITTLLKEREANPDPVFRQGIDMYITTVTTPSAPFIEATRELANRWGQRYSEIRTRRASVAARLRGYGKAFGAAQPQRTQPQPPPPPPPPIPEYKPRDIFGKKGREWMLPGVQKKK